MSSTDCLKKAIDDGKITQKDLDSKIILFTPSGESAIIWETFPGNEEGFLLLLAERQKMVNICTSFTIPSTIQL